MFAVAERDRVRARLIELARSDGRVAAAAFVGSSATSELDRYSDIDLALAIRDDAGLDGLIGEWTERIRIEFAAARLFDVPFRASRYRVFLLPGALQVDLSFAPASQFHPYGPRFALVFGVAGAPIPDEPAVVAHHLGLAAHHLVRANVSLERGRVWQACHWIASARDEIMTGACATRHLPTSHGRGFDDLPEGVRDLLGRALITGIDPLSLRLAWAGASGALIEIAPGVTGLDPRLLERMRELHRLVTG